MNISDLIGIIPTEKCIPIYDGCDWGYVAFDDYSQRVRDCLATALQAMLSSPFTSLDASLAFPSNNDIIVGNINGLIHLALVGSTIEIGSSNVDISGLYTNFMFNIFDGHNGFPIHMGSFVNIQGLDGLHFDVIIPDTIQIGLPTPDPSYFIPGRCVPSPGTYAWYIGHVAGMVTNVVIIADNLGITGNITLVGDGVSTIEELVNAWNIANPGNTVTLTCVPSGCEDQIPGNHEYIHLHGGGGPITCQPGDYQPFNKWLVLTWDNCHQTSLWLPPQCCLQTLNFNTTTGGINLTGGGHYDNGYLCTCGGCEPVGCNCQSSSNVTMVIPNPEPLPSINTDNQLLTLTDDCPNSQMLCLSRWHGGTLGVQIPDPDSCVDLININEHTWDLQGNMLYLLGSDGLVNDVVDLSQVNEETLGLVVDPIDPLHYHDPAFPRDSLLDIYGCDLISNDQINLINVASEMLTIEGRNMCIKKIDQPMPNCIPCKQQCIDLSQIEYTCEDVQDCICNAPIDWLDAGVVEDPLNDACSYVPPLPAGPIACADWGQRPTWSAQVYMHNARVIYNGKRYAALGDTLATDVPGVAAIWRCTSNSLWPNDAREAFFSTPKTISQLLAWIQGIAGGVLTNPCSSCCAVQGTRDFNIEVDTELVTRQKYWAVISMKNPLNDVSGASNRTMWSQHTDYGAPLGHNDGRNQRWFIPRFDYSKGRHSVNDSMVSTDWLPGSPFEHHHEIEPSTGVNGVLTIQDAVAPGTDYTYTFGTTYYHQTPSVNNPQTINESDFCHDGCKTITIVKDGHYQVSLQGVFQIDHNVHAFRYSCIRRNCHTKLLELIIDSKFGGGAKVGSASLADPLVPRTNEYHLGGTKVLLLYAGDIIFPAVKISPQTIWPKQVAGLGVAGERDLLYELNVRNPILGIYDPGTGDGSISWNYSAVNGGPNVATSEIPWYPSNLPNLSPHYFATSGGENGAQNYGWNLIYPGGDGDSAFGEYRYDDGVVTLYGPSSWINSDGGGSVGELSETSGATLAVHRVNNLQGDEAEYAPPAP